MKYKFTRMFMAIALLYSCVASPAQGISFVHGDFASVRARARAEKKLIFIDFYTVWCGPCRRMAQTVFTHSSVGAYFSEHFISCKIDAEKGEGLLLAAKYGVAIYPTFLFVDDEGNLYDHSVGYREDSAFIALAEQAQKEYTTPGNLTRLKAEFSHRKTDTAFLKTYIDKLVATEMPATRVIEQYLSVQTAMRPGSWEMLTFLTQYRNHLCYGGRAARALAQCETVARGTSDSAQLNLLDRARVVMLFRTRDYAKETGSEAFLKVFLVEIDKLDERTRAIYSKEGIWLDFYAATGRWDLYHRLANRWLDSICRQYARLPVPLVTDTLPRRTFFPATVQTPASVAASYAAVALTSNTLLYQKHFSGEKDVDIKVFNWVERALAMNVRDYRTVNAYANLLYGKGRTEDAIRWKERTLNTMATVSFHRDIILTNLEHMHRGEPLEEE